MTFVPVTWFYAGEEQPPGFLCPIVTQIPRISEEIIGDDEHLYAVDRVVYAFFKEKGKDGTWGEHWLTRLKVYLVDLPKNGKPSYERR